MDLNWKKMGIILLIIIAAALFAWLIYYFFFQTIFTPTEPVATENENVNVNSQLPQIANIDGQLIVLDSDGRLPLGADINGLPDETITPTKTAIGGVVETNLATDKLTQYLTLGANGDLLYYSPGEGKFYRTTPSGETIAITNQVFHDVSNITWSNNRQKAILEYPDGVNIVYDFKTDTQVTLPKHWEEFVFSPSDENIATKSIGLDKESRYLVVANADGSQAKVLEDIGGVEDKIDVNWSPNNQMVATFTEGRDLTRSNVYFIGLNKENFKLMVVEGRGFQGAWSPTGDKIFYSIYSQNSDYKPQLWVSDALPGSIGDNRKRINIETWAEKCAFADNDRIFCAVPIQLPFGAGFDIKTANNIPDQIYEINLKTGTKRLVAIPEGERTIGNIIVNNNQLFFTDKNTSQTYQIKL